MTLRFSSSYALAYDLLNESKPYKEEIDFVLSLYETFIKRNSLPANVLDLGCGSGMHLSKLPPSVKKTGVDLSESMLAVASKRNIPNSTYALANIGDFQTDEQFDLAWVDGGHSYDVASSDLANCARLGIKTILLDDTRTYPHSVGRAMIDFNNKCGYNLVSTRDDCRGIAWLEKIEEKTNENS